MTLEQWIYTPLSYDVRQFREQLQDWSVDELTAALERVRSMQASKVKQKMLEVELRRRERLLLKELAKLRLVAAKRNLQGGAS